MESRQIGSAKRQLYKRKFIKLLYGYKNNIYISRQLTTFMSWRRIHIFFHFND